MCVITSIVLLFLLALSVPRAFAQELWMKDVPADIGLEPMTAPGLIYDSPDIWINNSPMAGYTPFPFANNDPTKDVLQDPLWVNNRFDQHPQYTPTGYSKPVWIYVKVRNRSTTTASHGTEVLKVYWSKASTGLNWDVHWREYFEAPGGLCGAKTLFLGDEITKPRKNAAFLTTNEKARLIDAYQKINTTAFQYTDPGDPTNPVSFWFKQDEIHASSHIHCGPAFLPWHRELVNRLENILRQVNPEVKLPYWDIRENPTTAPSGGVALIGSSGYLGSSSSEVGSPFTTYDKNNCTGSRGDADCSGSTCGFTAGSFHLPPPFLTRSFNSSNLPTQTAATVVATGNSLVVAKQFWTSNSSENTFSRNLEVSNHNSAHGAIGGNIGNQHTSFEDPFVYLLHAGVDRLFSMWQRDQQNPGTPNNQFIRRLVPNDAVNGDVYGTTRSSINGDADLSSFPSCACNATEVTRGIQDPMQPWAGGDAHDPAVYPWVAPPRIVVKKSDDPSVVSPPIYSTQVDPATNPTAFVAGLLKVPVLGPGESCIMQIPWYPPDPKVASCTGDEGHYCLLARIERIPVSPYGMHFTETMSYVATNVVKNNNIAWKNVEIMPGLPGWPPPVPPPPHTPPCETNLCIGVGEVIVRNVNPDEVTNTKLVFGGVTNMVDLPAENMDKIVVDLGDQLFGLWAAGGYVGVGVTMPADPCTPTTIEVSPTGGWLGNILLGANEMDVIHLWAIPSATVPFLPYKFNLEQFTVATTPGVPDQFIGGELFRGNCDNAWDPILPEDGGYADGGSGEGDGGGGPAPKQSPIQGNPTAATGLRDLVCTVHPNPASSSVLICIEELPEGVPAVVEVLNALGQSVATLYNATPEAQLGLCFRFDCSQLTNGTYYAHIQNGTARQSVKISVQH